MCKLQWCLGSRRVQCSPDNAEADILPPVVPDPGLGDLPD